MTHFLFLFSIMVSSAGADTIKMVSDTWCPYACSPQSDRPGYMVEIAREIFAKHGHSVDYNLMNWARALAEVKSGKNDAILGASRAEIEGFVIPQLPAGALVNFFWVLKDNPWVYQNAKSLKSKSFGVINDYSYGAAIDEAIKNKNPAMKRMTGDEPLLRMIQMTENKRLDGFVENPLVLYYTLNKLKKSAAKFKIASKNLADDPDLFIAFSPANPKSKDYARILEEGLVELRESGRLKKILDKYGISDWK